MHVVGSHVRLDGSSDAGLVQRVREAPNFVPSDKALSGIPGLDGGSFCVRSKGCTGSLTPPGPATRMIF
jgi:hypothetical protein